MNRLLLLSILVILTHLLSGQRRPQNATPSPVRTYYEQTDSGVILFADNDAFCPFTIGVKMELNNMESDKGSHFDLVIPAQTRKLEIAKIGIMDPYKKSNFGFKTSYLQGNTLEIPDHEAVYRLPYPSGQSYVMSQGYNGTFSHEGKKALDFTMPEGTSICAARDGIVTTVVDDNNKGCPDKKCLYYANTITIYHDDGTFADYAHLKRNGSLVKPGDQVQAGQVIGYSGNTGFSSGPHLHFEVYYFSGTEQVDLSTEFDVDMGPSILLKEKKAYKAR